MHCFHAKCSVFKLLFTLRGFFLLLRRAVTPAVGFYFYQFIISWRALLRFAKRFVLDLHLFIFNTSYSIAGPVTLLRKAFYH